MIYCRDMAKLMLARQALADALDEYDETIDGERAVRDARKHLRKQESGD